jgi:hypothetical protein
VRGDLHHTTNRPGSRPAAWRRSALLPAVSRTFNNIVAAILGHTEMANERGAEALPAAGIFEGVHRPLISAELASALARCQTISEISVSELRR